MAAVDARAPLAGVRVLVTRPAHQAEHLVQLIEQSGGEAIRFPVVEITEPTDPAALRARIDRLVEFDLAIFISANAVERALPLVHARYPVLPVALTLAAIGAGTVRALRRFGVENVLAPTARFDSEALLALPPLQQVRGRKIVIFRGEGGRELLGDTLTARGAAVEYAECYRRRRPVSDIAPLVQRWARGGIDIVVCTSVEGLHNLQTLLGAADSRWLLRTPLVVVSARLAAAARALGCRHEPVSAQEASDEAIVAAIETWRATQNSL
jgi:uroporphyrinogen-III synthase